MKKYERSKELSYAECVEMVCNDNIILCNKIVNDEDFQECLYNHLFEEKREEIKKDVPYKGMERKNLWRLVEMVGLAML